MRKENKEPVRSGLKKLLGLCILNPDRLLGTNKRKGQSYAKTKNQKQIVYADVAIHDMPEKVSYKAKRKQRN